MVDHLTEKKRSWNMSRIRSRHTKPELIIRSLLHRSGYRFRINYAKLPGNPDIVLPKHETAIFIHGCFWHRHPNCSKTTMPNTNREYWKKKFERNIKRDKKRKNELKKLGWKVITLWECNIMKDPLEVLNFVIDSLGDDNYKHPDKEISRTRIIKIAEQKSNYYLNKTTYKKNE